ncbi:DNA polymerase III subunit gamma/tau [Patescibacteria group bacterium]
MTLYLKYRPQNLEELDSTDVRESLKKIVASKRIPHAFLFAGPKGIGKTSAARILAKVVNCESKKAPCGRCMQCTSIEKGTNLDVIEIDAASHRGIDDVRILRDAVGLSPTKAKKKVYIIDEAHMLTTEASNALLKTLEEPPEHVVFILATTNPEKLIATIKSRTTVVIFNKATVDEIVRSLKRVVKREKIKIDKDSLEVIAKSSGGSFRDAIKILEQALSEKIKLNKESLADFVDKSSEFNQEEFIVHLAKKDTKALLDTIENLAKKGTNMEGISLAITERLRQALLAKSGVEAEDLEDFDKVDLICLIELLVVTQKQLKDSPIEQLPLEIAVIKWCVDSNQGDGGDNEFIVKEGVNIKDSKNTTTSSNKTHAKKVSEIGDSYIKKVGDDIWEKILGGVRPINASICALLRATTPLGYDGKTLTLGVFYKFHKDRLEDGHHRKILEGVAEKILNAPTRIVCKLTPPLPKQEPVLTEGEDKDIIKVAEEIFSS